MGQEGDGDRASAAADETIKHRLGVAGYIYGEFGPPLLLP